MMRLNESVIGQLEPSGRSQDIYWDDLLPGFGVRVYKGGQKSWVVRYRLSGSKHLVVVGPTFLLGLDEARVRARHILLDAMDGKDTAKARRATKVTFEDFCREYVSRHAKPKKRSWREDQRRIERYLLPAFKGKRVSALRRSDVARLHAEIGDRFPYQANRILEMLSKMHGLARIWELVPETSLSWTAGIDPFPEISRDRFLSSSEGARLLEALQGESLTVRAVFLFLLLTGVRKRSVLNLAWKDVDFDRREMKLSAETEKNKKSRIVPLAVEAEEILRALPRSSPWIFPGKDPSKPLNNIDRAWKRILDRAQISDLQIHDLRRTVGCNLAQSGQSIHLIAAVLGQTSPYSAVVYAHFAQDHVRRALEKNASIVAGYRPAK